MVGRRRSPDGCLAVMGSGLDDSALQVLNHCLASKSVLGFQVRPSHVEVQSKIAFDFVFKTQKITILARLSKQSKLIMSRPTKIILLRAMSKSVNPVENQKEMSQTNRILRHVADCSENGENEKKNDERVLLLGQNQNGVCLQVDRRTYLGA